MYSAKQHHQKQYKPYHRLFPSRIEETTPPRIAREARAATRCSQLRALAQPVASRTPPLASKPDNSTDETAFRFPPAPAGCRRPCATSAAPHGRSPAGQRTGAAFRGRRGPRCRGLSRRCSPPLMRSRPLTISEIRIERPRGAKDGVQLKSVHLSMRERPLGLARWETPRNGDASTQTRSSSPRSSRGLFLF